MHNSFNTNLKESAWGFVQFFRFVINSFRRKEEGVTGMKRHRTQTGCHPIFRVY